MPMYEIERAEQGVRYRTYRVWGETKEDAEERIYEDEVEPQSDFFKQHDGNSTVKELRDCDCDECLRRGPWACQLEQDDD